MLTQRLSRRSLLKSAIVVGAATSVGPLLDACGGNTEGRQSKQHDEQWQLENYHADEGERGKEQYHAASAMRGLVV